MTEHEQAATTAANPAPTLDRYVSFLGLDCDAKAAALIGGLRTAMTAPGRADPFWDYFAAKLDGRRGPRHDALYFVHCHLNDLRDLSDRWGLAHLIELIENLEVECC